LGTDPSSSLPRSTKVCGVGIELTMEDSTNSEAKYYGNDLTKGAILLNGHVVFNENSYGNNPPQSSQGKKPGQIYFQILS
jgi:hypothetical protein